MDFCRVFITTQIASKVYNARVTEKGRLVTNHSLLLNSWNRRPAALTKLQLRFAVGGCSLSNPSLCFSLKKHFLII